MTTPLLILIGCSLGVILLTILWRHQGVAWSRRMTRLNAGVRGRAEWIAPSDVIEQVKRDYLAFYDYSASTLPQGWLPYARDLHDYLCGELLQLHRESLEMRMQHGRGRFVGILRAEHQLQVRNFSADGLRCVVVDQQEECRLATYDYWTGARLYTQDMGNNILVYQLCYDPLANHWKLERFIQELPIGTRQPHPQDLYLAKPLGRDS